MTFVSEPGSLPFSHKQSPCSQKRTALQTQPHRGRRKEVTADCPRTFPWKTIPGRNNRSTVVYRSKLPTPLPPHFLNLQLSRRNVLTSMSTLHLLRKIITRGKLQNVLSVYCWLSPWMRTTAATFTCQLRHQGDSTQLIPMLQELHS